MEAKMGVKNKESALFRKTIHVMHMSFLVLGFFVIYHFTRFFYDRDFYEDQIEAAFRNVNDSYSLINDTSSLSLFKIGTSVFSVVYLIIGFYIWVNFFKSKISSKIYVLVTIAIVTLILFLFLEIILNLIFLIKLIKADFDIDFSDRIIPKGEFANYWILDQETGFYYRNTSLVLVKIADAIVFFYYFNFFIILFLNSYSIYLLNLKDSKNKENLKTELTQENKGFKSLKIEDIIPLPPIKHVFPVYNPENFSSDSEVDLNLKSSLNLEEKNYWKHTCFVDEKNKFQAIQKIIDKHKASFNSVIDFLSFSFQNSDFDIVVLENKIESTNIFFNFKENEFIKKYGKINCSKLISLSQIAAITKFKFYCINVLNDFVENLKEDQEDFIISEIVFRKILKIYEFTMSKLANDFKTTLFKKGYKSEEELSEALIDSGVEGYYLFLESIKKEEI
ncbi:hypothetical protein SHELI_v1c06560 [Spiroplasma helicoides]|uniref:Uncharacterized protein n=1 Tax=Spiroplasma helicoides TaxID=216938 RepID=A0A1B3SL15_9MOLU|nr:hypothetical protein [Spiroplasma helicoides]AOG60607.1 hypothetical protein SHELI_v1c06560 [Spiroplasma helicoides]